MKIYNGTPHTISIINPNDVTYHPEQRKYIVKEDYENSTQDIFSHGILNAYMSEKEEVNHPLLPLVKRARFTHVDPLPENFDLYIVSQMYRSAYVEMGISTDNLACVCDPVYDTAIKPVGVLRLEVG